MSETKTSLTRKYNDIEYEVNGCKIYKHNTFSKDVTWKLEVAGKDVNLPAVQVSDTWNFCTKCKYCVYLSGGIILDEITIQSDLQINKTGDVFEVFGLVETGSEGNSCHVLRTGKTDNI